jgi:hypothetical protein
VIEVLPAPDGAVIMIIFSVAMCKEKEIEIISFVKIFRNKKNSFCIKPIL